MADINLGAGNTYNFDDAVTHVGIFDLQRSNLFSVVFATNPASKSKSILENMGGSIYGSLQGNNDYLGWTNGGSMSSVIGNITRSVINGATRYLIGAMSERLMRSIYGDFSAGSFMLDFFDLGIQETGLTIYGVGLPNNTLSYEMDKNHNAPNIRINGREYSPLILRFRVDRLGSNLTAMNDWVNSVEDPVTGLRALPIDVEADIQVNFHTRSGLPHTVTMFNGCIPIDVTQPTLSYDEKGEFAVFEVAYAYRSMQIGKVPKSMASNWMLKDIGSVIGNKVFSSKIR